MNKFYHDCSMIGMRDQNEDKHRIFQNYNGSNKKMAPINLYAVFDGHGGPKVSKFLDGHLSRYFVDPKVKYPLSKRYVNKVYNHLQQLLRVKFREFSSYSGSTGLVVIHFNNGGTDYLNVMNTGDCRVVLCRNNIAIPLTKDHKPEFPEEKRRITSLGGDIVFDGDDWRIEGLSVSRAFGDIKATPYVTHTPDIYRYPLDKRDKFMIIACDGLWDGLSNQDAVNYVLNMCYSDDLCSRDDTNINIARRLGELSIQKGSTDNITAIVVFFD